MKTSIYSIKQNGYGRKTITIEYSNGKLYKADTTDMPLYDQYNSDVFSVKDAKSVKRAEKGLIHIVKRANNLR